jgi:hypothetical protein
MATCRPVVLIMAYLDKNDYDNVADLQSSCSNMTCMDWQMPLVLYVHVFKRWSIVMKYTVKLYLENRLHNKHIVECICLQVITYWFG